MSRAERLAIPEAPRLWGAFRVAAIDLYFNSWRLIGANVIWGATLVVAILAGFVWPLGSLLLFVALGVPTAGIYRIATLIVRQEPVGFSDAVGAYRAYLRTALLLGLTGAGGSVIFAINIMTGLTDVGGPLGWAIATAAAWGMVFVWAWLCCLWPLSVDPRREGLPFGQRARLAALLMVAFPLRVGALLALSALILAVSTVLFAALITISVAFVALLGCHYILPAADRLEGRATVVLTD